MAAEDRLTRLRALVDRLARLPASPESEWMLREARARMVDVETGAEPRSVRPPPADPVAAAPRRDRDTPVKRPPKPEPPRAVVPETSDADEPRPAESGAAPEPSSAPLGIDGLLWLDDPPDPAPAADESVPASQLW